MIDSHSHIGTDSFHSVEGNLEQYVSFASGLGITSANLMPVPCPKYVSKEENGMVVQSLVWSFEGSRIKLHKKIIDSGGRPSLILNPSNPYGEYNGIVSAKLKESRAIDINFIPLIHPSLDSEAYLEALLNEAPKAIKIHGVAAGISPKEIPEDFWKILASHDIPLIVHTDYFFGTQPKNGLEYLYSKNQPLDWLNVLEKQGIRAFLAHGARLCPESLNRIKNSNNFIVGMSPDILLCSEGDRLHSFDNYLFDLFAKAGTDKIVLDLDYPWNVYSRKDLTLEWGLIERLKKLLSPEDFERVTRINASDFFKI